MDDRGYSEEGSSLTRGLKSNLELGFDIFKVMRRLLFLVTLLSLVFFFSPEVFAEEIQDFSVSIGINKDGTINVEEKLGYNFGFTQRHGIFRETPLIKKNQEGKKFKLGFEVLAVTDEDGQAYYFQESTTNERLRLKIGDPDETVSGLHTYVISYKVSGAITYFSDHDELYWNVTGNEWSVPINQVKTVVVLPESVGENNIRAQCFTGSTGEAGQDCQITKLADQITIGASKGLQPGEGLTIVVGWPKDIVAVLLPQPVVSFFETLFGKVIILAIFFLILFWYVFYPLKIAYKWFRYGRDPFVGVDLSAWYDPPKTEKGRALTPAEVGSLVDEIVHLRDISATIVDLARRGYFRIEERKKKDFSFVKTKNFTGDSALMPFERKLLEGLFKNGAGEVRVKEGKLFQTVGEVKKSLYQQMVKEEFFPSDPAKIRQFYTVIAILGIVTFNPLLAFMAATFGRHLARKTLAGAKAAHLARSLRNFLSSQQRQLEFQADKQMFFEKLLPYAVAFGVERIWAERFKDFDLQPPDWYQAYDTKTFNSALLVNGLQSSFSSVAASATPTRSSSGFSSGLSGGEGFLGGEAVVAVAGVGRFSFPPKKIITLSDF